MQVGYDQATDTMIVPPSVGAFFPRNVAGDPIKVILPGVTPGNFLEVDWRLNLNAALDVSYPTTFDFQAIAMVTFDGTDPTVPSANTFFIVDSWGSSLFVDPDGATADNQSISGLAAVLIPDGATDATVELLYITTGDTVVGGTTTKQRDVNGLSATLKATEIHQDIMSQGGPGNLSPST